ncbi:MAG TPA: isopentenyl-diphosphate Delta-isomerase [Wenzhouxiangella sp.]|nr:isopentenyl-diphosphate Delta-isomerase [Wenzhouxiangella sp.]
MALEQAGPARSVSHDSEELILVDEHDRVLGTRSKGECHDGEGILHRAFSLFLFDADGRLLIQQRGADKRLWPLYWANSCCSHPRAGEDTDEAAQRRLHEELGTGAELEYLYKFSYHARYGDLGSERELCRVYIGRVDAADLQPNPLEIDDWRFITPAEADALVADEKADVAPWFRMEWRELRQKYWKRVENLLPG